MCGIAGLISARAVDYDRLVRIMVDSIGYRGPDETGFYTDGTIGLGHARLAIIDPAGGSQPAISEDGGIVVIFNGEIYNHLELREELQRRGHRLSNNSDTAVLPHLYEEYGDAMFGRLNGQFAIAVWDKRNKRLLLGRDRYGEKPLYYHRRGDEFCFASEAKALFRRGLVTAEISPAALGHIFTFWTTAGDESVFQGVRQVLPGTCLIVEGGALVTKPFWRPAFPHETVWSRDAVGADERELTEELERRLVESVKNRMMADVPISFYLSGGLDSSLVACIAATLGIGRLNTFSVTFDDEAFDESVYQRYLSDALETNHRSVSFSRDRIPSLLREVVYHTEVPLLRSGAFPMYVLAGLVRKEGIKVVLTGEGSDELFGGYDIFREVKIRQFIARAPRSEVRPALYQKINNFVKPAGDQSLPGLSYFHGRGTDGLFDSHLSRWRLGAYSRQFFSREFAQRMAEDDPLDALRPELPADFGAWTGVQRAQYLEMATLFSNYLLSSQGDRVSMGQSVECRYPFLDYNLADFASALPDTMKIRGLTEKYILKKLARKFVPELITKRQKFPYRAPIDIAAMMRDDEVRRLLDAGSLRKTGIFNPAAVERFMASALRKESASERDCMIFMGLLTTQVLSDLFIRS
jgi:asparagine synthase (glutamine-hydrolysing)